MKKKKSFFQKRKETISIWLVALLSMGSFFSTNLEPIQAVGSPVSLEEDTMEWTALNEEIDQIEEQLALYQKAMEQLEQLLSIPGGGSLEFRLDEIVRKVNQKLLHLQDVINEVERMATVDFIEVNTEGKPQLEIMLTRVGELRLYAQNAKWFSGVVQEMLGLEAAASQQEMFQSLTNLKDQMAAYHQFLDQTETLIQLEGVSGSSSLVTGEQTREELDLVYTRMEEMKEQLDFFKELLPILLEREEILAENAEAQKALLEEVMQQKEATENWMSQIRSLLELKSDASQQEVLDKILGIQDTLVEYWDYLGKVESLIQMESGSHTATGSSLVIGSPVTMRFEEIYRNLTDMVQQQDKMAETIRLLEEKETWYQEKEAVYTKQTEELKKLKEEMDRQKAQTNQFLVQLKTLLGLQQEAGEGEILETILQMQTTLSSYWTSLGEVEKLLQMPNGSDLESSDIASGSAVTLRFTHLYEKLTDMMEQQEQMEETITTLQNRQDLSAERIQELTKLLEEMREQKEETNRFLNELKNVLGLGDHADYQEVIHTVSDLKEQLTHSLQLMRAFLTQLGMETEEGEENPLAKQLETVFQQVGDWLEQLEKEIEKTKQAENVITQLEQKIEVLTTEKKQSILENKQLKKEIEVLKQTSTSEEVEDWKIEREEWKRKYQIQKEQIAELQKRLQSRIEETEHLRAEKQQLSELVSNQEKERKEYQKQIELLKKQLAEKEQKIEEWEAIQKRQKPIQELLEQNQVSYEQLLLIISKLKEDPTPSVSEEEIPVIKSKEDLEESFVMPSQESEIRKVIQQEMIQQETISQEMETTCLKREEPSSNGEEVSAVTEECSCGIEECQINQEECFCGTKECQRNPEEYFCGVKDCSMTSEVCICEMEDCQINGEECTCTIEEWKENTEESSKIEESLINKEEEMTENEEETKAEPVITQEEERKNEHFGIFAIFILFLSILIGLGVLVGKNRKKEKE